MVRSAQIGLKVRPILKAKHRIEGHFSKSAAKGGVSFCVKRFYPRVAKAGVARIASAVHAAKQVCRTAP